jgi:hypothetical protein
MRPFVGKRYCTCACTAGIGCLLAFVVAGPLAVDAQDDDPVVLTTPTVIIEGPYGTEEEVPEPVDPVVLTTPTVIIEGPYGTEEEVPEPIDPVVLTTPTVIIEGPYGLGIEAEEEEFEAEEIVEDEFEEEAAEGDETEGEELVEADEAEEEVVTEEEEVEEEIEEEVAEFIAELLSVYKARRVEEFEDLVSIDYREMRRSDEGRETLDYDALLAAMRQEVDLVDALRIKHTIHRVGRRDEDVRVRIQWKMRFQEIESGRKMNRKGITELVLVNQGQLQLIGQSRDALFGAITSDSLEGDVTEKPTRPKRKRDR